MIMRAKISIPKFDVNRYTEALERELEVQMRQAAREWLRAVIPRVPVWAGTSRGSLKPLGRFLRVAIPIGINPTSAGRKGVGPELGAAQSSFDFTTVSRKFTFTWDTTVRHFITNNFYDVSSSIHLITPGPYGAFEAGKAAFDRYVQTVIPQRIPRLQDYVKYQTKVTGG